MELIRTCPVCHVSFAANAINQLYDTANCKARGERQRRRERGRAQRLATPGFGMNEPHYGSMLNPTAETLDFYAQLYLRVPKTKPIIFQGVLPEGWQPPKGVNFGEVEGGGSVMGHISMLGLDRPMVEVQPKAVKKTPSELLDLLDAKERPTEPMAPIVEDEPFVQLASFRGIDSGEDAEVIGQPPVQVTTAAPLPPPKKKLDDIFHLPPAPDLSGLTPPKE